MWLDETSYRINCLKENIKYYSDDVAIYGTGINTQRILEEVEGLNVAALVDDYRVGDVVFGHEVISLDDAIKIGIRKIIIGAEAGSSIAVTNRILDKCIMSNVTLFNMYGKEEKGENKEIKQSKSELNDYCNVFVECRDALIQFDVEDSEAFLNSFFFSIGRDDLCEARKKAEVSYYSSKEPYDLWDVYEALGTYVDISLDELDEIYKAEENYWINSAKINKDVVKMIEDKDRVVVLSDYLLGSSTINRILEVNGVLKNNICCVSEKDMKCTFSDGMIRKVRENYQMQSVVYIGVNNRTGTFLSKVYGIETIELNADREWKRLDISRYVTESSIKLKNSKNGLVIVCTVKVPEYDRDAGSKTVYLYCKLLAENGFDVKIVTPSFWAKRKYAYQFSQMGIDVIEGEWWKKNFDNWIYKNRKNVKAAWLHYPTAAARFLDVMKKSDIYTIYYGHDLHYLRVEKEYKITREKALIELSDKLAKLEGSIIDSVDVSMYPSDEEIRIIKSKFRPKITKQLIPFFYEKSSDSDYVASARNGIMFIGGYDHQPNVDAVLWFLEKIYPIIAKKKKIPFYIIGSNEPKELLEKSIPGVVHVGQVTDSKLSELYSRIKLSVIPLRYGAGVKGKTVDAMYYGVPVITTPIGAEGIPGIEHSVCIAETSTEFANKVIDLYDDEEKLTEMSKREINIIENYFSKAAAWNHIKNYF